MKFSDDNFSLLAALLLGVAQMCMMCGYDVIVFLVESVLHSVRNRYPDRITDFAGYYGQSVLYLVYTFTNLITPAFLHYCGSKVTLFIGSLGFTIFCASFVYVHNYIFYPSCTIVGIAFAFFYTGAGCYLTEHSSAENLSRNTAIVWMVGSVSMIFGGGILILISHLHTESIYTGANATVPTSEITEYRSFSDNEIIMMSAVFSVVAFLSNAIMIFLPRKDFEGSLARKSEETFSLKRQLSLMFNCMLKKEMLMLAPFFLYAGIQTSFWISVYATTIIFSKSLTHLTNLPALYCIFVGIGEVINGTILSLAGKKWPSFGLRSSLFLCGILSAIHYTLIALFTPNDASIHPTESLSIFPPQPLVCLLIGIIGGMIDSCVNTARTMSCVAAMPDNTAQAFSISKFYQSLASGVIFSFSSFITIRQYLIMMGILLFISAFFYLRVIRSQSKIRPENKLQITLENKNNLGE